MKNKKGNKHLKNAPYFTLAESLKDDHYVILQRLGGDNSFNYIVGDTKDEFYFLEDAEAILHGCIFRKEKDADIFLDKIIRNLGYTQKEEFNKERLFYRVMTIKEMFMENRIENEEREFARNERYN